MISGFIILYVHYHDINSPPRLRHYIGRRFTRVMPTYWVALALTIFIAAGGHTELPSVSDLFWSVSLAPSDHRLLLGIAWTLRFELLFYAIFCILILHRITGLIVMGVWLAAIIVVATGHSVGPGPISLLTGTFNLEFFFGMAAAYTLRNRSIPAPKNVADDRYLTVRGGGDFGGGGHTGWLRQLCAPGLWNTICVDCNWRSQGWPPGLRLPVRHR